MCMFSLPGSVCTVRRSVRLLPGFPALRRLPGKSVQPRRELLSITESRGRHCARVRTVESAVQSLHGSNQ